MFLPNLISNLSLKAISKKLYLLYRKISDSSTVRHAILYWLCNAAVHCGDVEECLMGW